ncbi:uncharacterized protein LOC116803635 [Drosophila sechellia]|uniref:uncharacterized protein LOC116803635 n=1 Tax=Drosophila sechellia TaxID=7238 RepID=UPI0013DE5A0B|nr:uncharacterized protein LOC116803635 [Drosophila sechellia]
MTFILIQNLKRLVFPNPVPQLALRVPALPTMAIVPISNIHSIRANPLQGLEFLYVPLHYSVHLTTTLISAIGNFLYRLWSPPLRRSC